MSAGSVNDKGELDIKRVVIAIDYGYVVIPDSVVAQIQSCVVFVLTAANWGEIEINNGRAVQAFGRTLGSSPGWVPDQDKSGHRWLITVELA